MAGLIFFWVRPCTKYEPAEPADPGTVFAEKDPVLAAVFVPKAGSTVVYNRRLPEPWCKHE